MHLVRRLRGQRVISMPCRASVPGARRARKSFRYFFGFLSAVSAPRRRSLLAPLQVLPLAVDAAVERTRDAAAPRVPVQTTQNGEAVRRQTVRD